MGAVAVAIKQIDQDDRGAYEACVTAKSDWLNGRMDHSHLDALLNDLGRPGNDGKRSPDRTNDASLPKQR